MAGRGQKALIPTSEEQEISVAWRVEDLNKAQEGIAQEGETVAWQGEAPARWQDSSSDNWEAGRGKWGGEACTDDKCREMWNNDKQQGQGGME